MFRVPDSLPFVEITETFVDSAVNGQGHETRLDRPRRIERTVVMDSLDVAVDDLPAAPDGGTPRDVVRELRELIDFLRSRLRAVEAQVVSLVRELTDPARCGADDDRALALITSSIEAIRSGLRMVDRCEIKFGLERRYRPMSPIPL